MTVESLGRARLDESLSEVASFSLELDDIDPNHYFTCSRRASEISLYGAEVTAMLAARWESLNPSQRQLAVMLARDAPSPAMTPHLIRCTAPGQSWYLRLDAVTALGAADPELAAPVLEALTEDGDETVRTEALKALQDLDHVPDVTALDRHLGDPDAQLRTEAVHSLAQIPGSHAASRLLAALDDPQMGVALAAKKHLLARKDERDLVLDMVARLQDFGKRGRYRLPCAVEILGRLEDPRAIDPLLEHLETCRNNEVKSAIIKTIARFKDQRILPGLWRLALDEHEKVQAAALKALKRHPHVDSVPTLRAVVEKIQRTGDCSVYVDSALAESIAKIPGEDADALLVDCLVSPAFRLVKAAVPPVRKRKLDVPVSMLAEHLRTKPPLADDRRALYETLVDPQALARAAPAVEEPVAKPKQQSALESWGAVGHEIDAMTDAEVVRYVQSRDSVREVHDHALDRLLRIETAEASLQLRRFLKAEMLYKRALAARTLAARGLELTRHDEVAMIVDRPRSQHEELEAYPEELGDLLQEGVVDPMSCSDRMIRILWEAEHPFRVPFALRWLGTNINGEKYGKVAFDCLKSEPAVSEPAALEAFLDPSRRPRIDRGELALLLGRFRCRAAVEALIDGTCDQDEPERRRKAFVEALGLLGDQRAVEPLLRLLPVAQEGPLLRKVIDALVRLKATAAVPELEARPLRDPRLAKLRDAALERLRRA